MRSKNSLLLLISGVLLFANLVLIWLYLGNHENKQGTGFSNRQAFVKDYLRNDVGFNVSQLDQYDSLQEKHQDQIKPMFDQLNADKKTLLSQLVAAGFSDSAMGITASALKSKQEGIELSMLRHLREIRSLCTREQLVRFDSSFYKIVGRRKMNESKKKKDGL